MSIINKDPLLNELEHLKAKERYLKNELDTHFYDYQTRTKSFIELKKVKSEIQKIEFLINLKKELNNEKSRKDVWRKF